MGLIATDAPSILNSHFNILFDHYNGVNYGKG